MASFVTTGSSFRAAGSAHGGDDADEYMWYGGDQQARYHVWHAQRRASSSARDPAGAGAAAAGAGDRAASGGGAS